ncbi:MAG: hypothetical protein LLG44_08935 [Chloroflexi bacterium]|nr:hypothetical protein [Chloroflexota bacterium]
MRENVLDWVLERCRVPEPREIALWFVSLPARAARYLADPAHLVCWSITALALVLRLAYLDAAPFAARSAEQLLASSAILEGNLPLTGIQTSNGITMPALGSYLYALPLLISRDPRWVTAFTVIVNVLAIVLAYGVLQRWFNQRTAVFAMGLWAASPWAMLQSREIGSAALVPFLCMLVICGLEMALHQRQPAGWLLAWLAGWLLVNLSLYFWPVLVLLALVSLCNWRNANWPLIMVASGLGVILLVPYLYYQSYVNFRDIAAVFAPAQADTKVWGFDTVLAALRTTSGLGIAGVTGSARETFLSHRLPWSFIEAAAAVILMAGALIGSIRVFIKLSRWNERSSAAADFITFAWIVICLAAAAKQPVSSGTDFLALYIPFGFIAFGRILDGIFDAVIKFKFKYIGSAAVAQILLMLTFAALELWPVYSTLNLLSLTNRVTALDGYGLPLRFWMQAARSADTVLNAQQANTLYVAGGSQLGAGSRTASLRYLLPDTNVINLCPDDGRCLLIPLYRPMYYLSLQPSLETLHFLAQIGGREVGLTTQLDKGATAQLYALPPVAVDTVVSLIPERKLWSVDDGQLFLGYSLVSAQAGQQEVISTFWSFQDGAFDQLSHGLALRAYEDEETLAEQRSSLGFAEQYWSMDKVFVRWLIASDPTILSAGRRTQLGIYRLPDHVLNRTLDEDSGTPSLAIELEPASNY